jgi:nitrate reductase NapE
MRRSASGDENADPASKRWLELAMFLFLAVVLWPLIAVGVVGAYGFVVWMNDLLLGPPTII